MITLTLGLLSYIRACFFFFFFRFNFCSIWCAKLIYLSLWFFSLIWIYAYARGNMETGSIEHAADKGQGFIYITETFFPFSMGFVAVAVYFFFYDVSPWAVVSVCSCPT